MWPLRGGLNWNNSTNYPRKVRITSIHGTDETLGEEGANIMYEDLQIPVNLQVMKISPVQEDGIIGFDVFNPTP